MIVQVLPAAMVGSCSTALGFGCRLQGLTVLNVDPFRADSPRCDGPRADSPRCGGRRRCRAAEPVRRTRSYFSAAARASNCVASAARLVARSSTA